jgi:hypothetical protein
MSAPERHQTVGAQNRAFYWKIFRDAKGAFLEGDLNANFACYPATDEAFPNNRRFVCYTSEEQPRVPE